MSLLKTHAEKSVDEILSGISESYTTLLKNHRHGYNRVWNNSITPDEVVAEMGTRGLQLMLASWAAVELIRTVNPNALSDQQALPKRAIIPQLDGSVTLAPPPEGFDAWMRPIPPPSESDLGDEGIGEE